MSLTDYFESVQGLGILATADSERKVDFTLYTGPHVIDETRPAFEKTKPYRISALKKVAMTK